MFNVDNEYDIPRDVVNHECLMQMTGNSEIVLENFKCIKKLCEEEIEIVCKKYMIKITGTSLCVKFYNCESMIIGGCIHEVSFL
ncbi:MAG: hypothetical protein HFG31_02950 [Eubacterium sp.]|nr:hypothetical protein [Eubacterium sp.]